MKCGITLAKEQKLMALEKNNYNLEKELKQLLADYEQHTAKVKSQESLIMNLQGQIETENAQYVILNASLQQKLSLLEELNKNEENDKEQLLKVEEENKRISSRHHLLTCELLSKQQTINRLEQQLKTYQLIGKNNGNMVKTTEKLKKEHECLLRKLAIFQKKLDSHHRYLEVIQKKKLIEEQKKEQKNVKGENTNQKRLRVGKKQMVKEEESTKFAKPQAKSMKQMDSVIRKKNLILMQSKKN